MTELVALDPHLFGPNQPCFGCSPDHPIGFRLRFFLDGADVIFTGEFTFALLDRVAAERLLGKALPESWEPFAR